MKKTGAKLRFPTEPGRPFFILEVKKGFKLGTPSAPATLLVCYCAWEEQARLAVDRSLHVFFE